MQKYSDALKRFKTDSLDVPNLKRVLIAGGALLLLFFLMKGPFSLFKGETKLDPVQLSFQSDSQTLSSESHIKVMVDAKSYEIGFVHVKVNFDNDAIALHEEVMIDSRFATIIQKSSKDEANNTGEIVFAVGLKPGDPFPSGNVEVAKLPFIVKESSTKQTTLQFDTGLSQIVNMKAQELPLEKTDLTLSL